MTSTMRTIPTAAQVVKVSAAFGRLYVSGPGWQTATAVRGAHVNPVKQWVEISLTLDALKELRQALRIIPETFARMLTPEVLAWARAAAKSERVVTEMHRRLATGWRQDLPWQDVMEGRRPFAHQKVMASVATMLDGCAFLCDMGTGKTRAALEATAYLERNHVIQYGFVVAPRSVLSVWVEQCRRWTPALVPVLLDGRVAQRKEILAHPEPGRLYLANYDVLAQLESTVVAAMRREPWIVIFDEMHKIKNPQAQWTKSAMEVARHARWRLGQTGTPVLNGAWDIWSEWYVVDLGVTFGANFVQFRREWFDQNPYDFDKLTPKADTLERIGLRLRRRGLRYRKDECLDLPPKVYERMDVSLTAEQQRAYDQMEETLVAELARVAAPADGDEDTGEDDRFATAATQLVAILRLTQITSGFVNDENGEPFRFTPNPKLDAVETLVREQIGEQQIIVWAHYREDIRAICARLADLHPAVIQGGQTQTVRAAAEADFQAGRTRLLVANPASGGLGLNLQAASLAIYYSQDYSLGNRGQSEDRCHRAGSEQHHKVTYVDLVATGTVDEVVLAALRGKKTVAEAVTDLRASIGLAG